MTRLLQSLAWSAAMCSALALSSTAAAACSGADTAALVACINSLEAKVDSLQSEVSALKAKADNPSTEQKLSALTAENAQMSARISAMADEGASSGDTVKAPFVVTDDAGNPIFKVESYRGTGALVTTGGNGEIQMSASAGSGAKLQLGGNGSRIGTWTVTQQASRLSLGSFADSTVLLADYGQNQGGIVSVRKAADTSADLVATDKMIGISVYARGQERANLGIPQGKDSAVRIVDLLGQQVAAMGSRVEAGGAGALYLGNGKTNGVTLLSNSNAEGSLSLLKGGDLPVIQLRAFDTSIGIYDDKGGPLGTLMMSQNSKGGNLTLNNSNGEGVVSGGGTTAGDGALCVSRIKTGQTCLGVGLPLR